MFETILLAVDRSPHAERAAELVRRLAGETGDSVVVLHVTEILALDIGTDLLPALALGAEPPEPGVMERQPRARSARSLDRAVLARAFGFLGPVEAVASLALLPVGAALFFGWHLGMPLPAGGPALATLSTMVFAAIVLAQMANASSAAAPGCRCAPSARRPTACWWGPSPSRAWRCWGSST